MTKREIAELVLLILALGVIAWVVVAFPAESGPVTPKPTPTPWFEGSLPGFRLDDYLPMIRR